MSQDSGAPAGRTPGDSACQLGAVPLQQNVLEGWLAGPSKQPCTVAPFCLSQTQSPSTQFGSIQNTFCLVGCFLFICTPPTQNNQSSHCPSEAKHFIQDGWEKFWFWAISIKAKVGHGTPQDCASLPEPHGE